MKNHLNSGSREIPLFTFVVFLLFFLSNLSFSLTSSVSLPSSTFLTFLSLAEASDSSSVSCQQKATSSSLEGLAQTSEKVKQCLEFRKKNRCDELENIEEIEPKKDLMSCDPQAIEKQSKEIEDFGPKTWGKYCLKGAFYFVFEIYEGLKGNVEKRHQMLRDCDKKLQCKIDLIRSNPRYKTVSDAKVQEIAREAPAVSLLIELENYQRNSREIERSRAYMDASKHNWSSESPRDPEAIDKPQKGLDLPAIYSYMVNSLSEVFEGEELKYNCFSSEAYTQLWCARLSTVALVAVPGSLASSGLVQVEKRFYDLSKKLFQKKTPKGFASEAGPATRASSGTGSGTASGTTSSTASGTGSISTSSETATAARSSELKAGSQTEGNLIADPRAAPGSQAKVGSGAEAESLPQVVVSRSAERKAYIESYERRIPTSPTENQNFANIALVAQDPKKIKFFHVENSQMKYLNDTTKDQSLVTSLTNQYEEMILNNIKKMTSKEFPGLKMISYSDYKGARVAFQMANGKAIPESLGARLEKELAKIYKGTNEEFGKKIKELNILRKEDKPEEWFRAGFGRTAEEANIASRLARKQEGGANDLLNYSDAKVTKELQESFVEIEARRKAFETKFGSSPLSESIEISASESKMIPEKKILELCRKSETPEELLQKLKEEFRNTHEYKEIISQLSLTDSENILKYSKLVDKYSPSVYQVKRDIASFSASTVNGVSSDFAGMGASNLKGTAAALAIAKDVKQSLVEARIAERQVTHAFELKKNEYTKIVTNYLQNKKKYNIDVLCSGDDCIISLADRMSPKERQKLVDYIALNCKQIKPSEIRTVIPAEN